MGWDRVAGSSTALGGSCLHFIQDGTLPSELPATVTMQVQAMVSEGAPDEVLDAMPANNNATDVNTYSEVFGDGFEGAGLGTGQQ